MCDQNHFEDDVKLYSRRAIGSMAVAAGLSAAWPVSAKPGVVVEKDVQIQTPDGLCDAVLISPTTGPGAAVLVWPDIFGLRPAFRQMGRRLAESGYTALVVNPFYRQKKAPTAPDGAMTPIADVMPMLKAVTPAMQFTDAAAYVAWLDARPEVDKDKKMAATGYCMGGAYAVRTGAVAPARVGAVATFHGGGLATASEDSPHLLFAKTKAEYLIAVAESDDKQEPEVKGILRKTLDDAKLKADIEVFPAAHGWCPPDTRAYNAEQSERAWSKMLALFGKTLS